MDGTWQSIITDKEIRGYAQHYAIIRGEGMKKIWFMLFCVMLMVYFSCSPAYGDMGPKPSVVIDFEGLEGRTYYVTLLSNVRHSGPYSAIDDNNESGYSYREDDKPMRNFANPWDLIL